jgi:hypothetical protein
MAVTPSIRVAVAPELLSAARAAAGRPDVPAAEVIRLALAHLAGVDPEAHPVRLRRGRRPRRAGGTDLQTGEGSAA